MSTETGREFIGATDGGEVSVITKSAHDGFDENGKRLMKDVFSVRQGGRTILETENHDVALATAQAIVGIEPEAAAVAVSGKGRGKAKAEPEPEPVEV